MHLHDALFILSALAPLARAVTFTSPDTSRPINISEPVAFEWTTDDNEYAHARHPWLELGFSSDFVGVWWLVRDSRIDVRNTSSWTWDAPAWTEGMIESRQILSAGRHNHFETLLYDYQHTNESGGSIRLDEGNFAVVGYPYLESGAGATTPSLILVLSAGAVAIVASLSTGGY
jgi:hypothetical protein